MSPKSNRKIVGFNGLRTIALLGVLIYHMKPTLLPGGYFGVIIFFVISGFLSGYGGVREIRYGRFTVWGYFKKRILRIYPPLLVVIPVTVGLMTIFAPNRMATIQPEVLSILGGYNNYWQIGAQADYFNNLSANSPFTHLWYIAILLQFDLAFTVYLGFYRRSRRKAGIIPGMLGIFALTFISFLVMPVTILLKPDVSVTALYYGTHTRVFSLLAGACIGMLCGEGLRFRMFRVRNQIVQDIILLITLVATFLFYRHSDGRNLGVYLIGMQYYTLLVSLAVAALSHSRSRAGELLDNPLFNFLSKYSYEIYLWQYPVFLIFTILYPVTVWYHYLIQAGIVLILSLWLNDFIRRITTRRKAAEE